MPRAERGRRRATRLRDEHLGELASLREWVRGQLADHLWSGGAEWGGQGKGEGEGQLPLLKMGLS